MHVAAVEEHNGSLLLAFESVLDRPLVNNRDLCR